jgi:hypothetical protein
VAALAGGLRLLELCSHRRVAVGGRPAQVRGLWGTDVGDSGDDLRPHAHAADGVVYRLLAFATQKDGVSALSIQRALDIGSYQTAWAMLHRLRSVLVRPGRERLQGTVEVDETYIGGDEPGLSGGRAKGKKVLVGIAVQRAGARGFGRCRMAVLADGVKRLATRAPRRSRRGGRDRRH